MKDSEKIQFLISRLVNDRRVGLKDVIIQARFNNLSYDQTVDNLIRINAEMSESNQTVKMAAVFPPKSNKTKANNNETIATTLTSLESAASAHLAYILMLKIQIILRENL